MTTTTQARPLWTGAVTVAVSAIVLASAIHVLSSEVTWRNVITFALASALVAAAVFVAVRSVRVVGAVLIAAAAVYASRSFLSAGLINVMDVALLLADDFVAPFVGTWSATFVITCAVMIALEARRKIWIIALLSVIAAVTIPTRFPDLM